MWGRKMQPVKSRKKLVTLQEAQELLSCSRGTVERLLREGQLERVRLGKALSWRITMASIEKLIGKQGQARDRAL